MTSVAKLSTPLVLSLLDSRGRAPSLSLPRTPAVHAPPPPPLSRAADQPPLALNQSLDGIVHILTCGSVDDGKSTLIGRLLWDAGDLHDDQRETLRRSSAAAGGDGAPDYSLLLDGLTAEREQGITIDIAWRYFDTAHRRFVIIDSPGHEQYTRNMASGASHADVAIMLVDARHGIKRQTRRHAAILDLVGVRRVVLAVNKMDLVEWSQARFMEIAEEFTALVLPFGFESVQALPVAGKLGDSVAARSARMPWYTGPTLLDALYAVPSRASSARGDLRFPVQTTVRGADDFRGFAGTLASGTVKVGDSVREILSGKEARVARIATFDRDLIEARAGQAVVLQLDADIDAARGAMFTWPEAPSTAARELEARLVWLADVSLQQTSGLLLRTVTDLVPINGLEITTHLDLETLVRKPGTTCATNDIVEARIALARNTALDTFARHPETGRFVLVDALTGATVAGGVVTQVRAEARPRSGKIFKLTYALLAQTLCSDLPKGKRSEAEFRRRAHEVAFLLSAAGAEVDMEEFGEEPGEAAGSGI